jgi:D-alanyl-D-alanine carboxypeptidase (penicillin-binding protein 5/6)
LDYGFANFETTLVNQKGEEVQPVEVKKGLGNSVNAIYKEDVKLLVKKGEKGKIERIVKIEPEVTAPVKAGQKIGEVTYLLAENELGKADLVAANEVQRASFIRLFFRMVIDWFDIGRTTE